MVSVVIPAFNEENTIVNCLESFSRQTTREQFEIILVDNNSTDQTVKVAKSVPNLPQLRIIKELKKGRGAARAAGFKAAKGSIIFSTDADAIVPNNWIDGYYHYFEDPEVVAVTGTALTINCSRTTNAFMNWFQPRSMKLYRLYAGHFWLTGFNFAIRKDAYEKAGGFDPDLNAIEDVDLAARVNRVGKIVYSDEYPVQSSGRRFRDGIAQGLFSYAQTYREYKNNKKSTTVMSDVR